VEEDSAALMEALLDEAAPHRPEREGAQQGVPHMLSLNRQLRWGSISRKSLCYVHVLMTMARRGQCPRYPECEPHQMTALMWQRT
jgi:hypothetical protein